MGIVAICHYSFANCGNRIFVLYVYYIFVNQFYFICVKAITLLFNKHFCIQNLYLVQRFLAHVSYKLKVAFYCLECTAIQQDTAPGLC